MKNQSAEKAPHFLSYDEIMNTPQIQNGHLLFHDSCASSHALNKTDDMMSQKIVDSDYDKNVLYAFIRNSDSVIKSGNVYYNNLHKKYGVEMTSFPNLTTKEIDEIIDYIKVEKAHH